jgi:hypothetical protein
MPVIVATQEAAIRRTKVRSQSEQIVPYLENTHHKKDWQMAQGEGPEFKSQYCQKKKGTHKEKSYVFKDLTFFI